MTIFKRKNTLLIILSLLIILILIAPLNHNSKSEVDNNNLKISQVSSPISVSGTEQWINLKQAGSCTGSGTSIDPYVIRGLNINGGGSENCISIYSCEVFFRIEGCTLFNAGSGISLYRVQNGYIKGNNIYDCSMGIWLWESDNNIVLNNALNTPADGISLNYCDYNVIYQNSARESESGIRLDVSAYNLVLENTLENNEHGINSWKMRDNQILRNFFRNNIRAIHFGDESTANIISGNIFIDNEEDILGEQYYEGNIQLNYLILIPMIITLGISGLIAFLIENLIVNFKQIREKVRREEKVKQIVSDKEVFPAEDYKEALEEEIELEKPVEPHDGVAPEPMVITDEPEPLATNSVMISEFKEAVEEESLELEQVDQVMEEITPTVELSEAEELTPTEEIVEEESITETKEIPSISVEERGIELEQVIEKIPTEMVIEKPEALEKVKALFCTNCGKQLKPAWRICPYCSFRIKKEEVVEEVLGKPLVLEEVEVASLKERVPKVAEPAPIEMKEEMEISTPPTIFYKADEITEPEKLELIEPPIKPIKEEIISPKPVEEPKHIPKPGPSKPTINICQFCGLENELDKIYCVRCGYKLKR